MIQIGGKQIDTMPAFAGFSPNSMQQGIFSLMQKSKESYRYDRIDQLVMELRLRYSIVMAARGMARSGVSFQVFRKSFANPEFWVRSNDGAFQLRRGILPSDGIRDIYRHGSLYGTECSTVMTMIYYKALMDIFPENLYNRLYSGIYLMNWGHLDHNLAIARYARASDELPGDARYFINPDVNPLTPQWQGENVFYLGNREYFGHGAGVVDTRTIIRGLNSLRREGATRSAYLLESGYRQNYHYLANILRNNQTEMEASSLILEYSTD